MGEMAKHVGSALAAPSAGSGESSSETRFFERMTQHLRQMLSSTRHDERRQDTTGSGLAASPRHFAALLGGHKTIEQLKQESADQNKNQESEQTAKKATSTIGSLAMNFGKLGGAVGILATILGKLAISGRAYGERRSEANRDMAVFNQQIGQSFANLGRQQTTLQLRSGDGTAASTEWLNQERMRNNEAYQKWDQFFTNLGNRVGGGLMRASSWIMEAVNGMFEKRGLEAP